MELRWIVTIDLDKRITKRMSGVKEIVRRVFGVGVEVNAWNNRSFLPLYPGFRSTPSDITVLAQEHGSLCHIWIR